MKRWYHRVNPIMISCFKVQPFLDAVIKAFRKEYCPNQNLSIDEAMVAFKGQLKLNMKQYVPLEMI